MSGQPQGFTQGSVRAGAQTAAGGGRARVSKPFFLMSEFLTLVALIVALLIAAAVDDDFGATLLWPLVTALGFAYIVSRGLAKRDARDTSDLPVPEQGRGV